MIKIAFVILAYNSEEYIEECLHSIAKLPKDIFNCYIIIVDNGNKIDIQPSIDCILGKISHYWAYHVVKNTENKGTSYSRNQAIKYLQQHEEDFTPDYICFLDSDAQINEKSLMNMIATLQKENKCLLTAPFLHDLNLNYQRIDRPLPTLSQKIKGFINKNYAYQHENKPDIELENQELYIPTSYLVSACWLVPYGAFSIIGLFDEKIFYSPEDADWCLRIWKQGYNLKLTVNADIIHVRQALSHKNTQFRNYHIKGLFYFWRKHKFLFREPEYVKQGKIHLQKSL